MQRKGVGVSWNLLLVGLVVTLAPLSNVAFILLLATKRGTTKGIAFIVGWVVSLAVVILATLAVTGGRPPKTQSSGGKLVAILLALVGLALVGLALNKFRRMRVPVPAKREESKWLKRINNLSLTSSALLGIFLQPWPFVAAGAAIVASDSDLSKWASILSLLAFAILATGSLLVMETYALVARVSAMARLARLHAWIDKHRDQVVAWLALALGVLLVSRGLIPLLSSRT